MNTDTKAAIAQYGLLIQLKDRERVYQVTVGGVSISLPDFCKRLGLKYPSVIQAINRKSWTSGIHLAEFKTLVEGMVARKRRGTVRCPCCGKGSIPAMYKTNGSGVKLVPRVTIEWTDPSKEAPLHNRAISPTHLIEEPT